MFYLTDKWKEKLAVEKLDKLIGRDGKWYPRERKIRTNFGNSKVGTHWAICPNAQRLLLKIAESMLLKKYSVLSTFKNWE